MPLPGPGEVLIQILATRITASDIDTSRRKSALSRPSEAAGGQGVIRFPRLQGTDLCGRVVRLGKGRHRASNRRAGAVPDSSGSDGRG